MDLKKAVIIFSVLLMLSGGTISTLKWLEIGPFEKTAEDDAAAVEEAVPETPPIAIDMDELYITIFAEDRVAATVMIRYRIEVIGVDNEEKVTKLIPRLSDAFFQDLHSFIPRIVRLNKKLNAAILSARMLMTGGKVMEPGVIDKIVIEEVSER